MGKGIKTKAAQQAKTLETVGEPGRRMKQRFLRTTPQSSSKIYALFRMYPIAKAFNAGAGEPKPGKQFRAERHKPLYAAEKDMPIVVLETGSVIELVAQKAVAGCIDPEHLALAGIEPHKTLAGGYPEPG